MTMMRAGRYTVTDGSQLAGRITGDFVIGFRAELPDGSVLADRYPDPASAAKALKAAQTRYDARTTGMSRLAARYAARCA